MWVTGLGYGLFAAGLISNGFMTYETDFKDLFWPQIFRGAAVLFCLLPTTALALNGLPAERLSNASGLFNLMRNLGGAIGIALIDTILEQRTSMHAVHLTSRLKASDVTVLKMIGLSANTLPLRQGGEVLVMPFIQRAALVMSFNEAWLMMGAVFAFAALMALSLGKVK
jgi:DHA2 family multidrug resistance protein